MRASMEQNKERESYSPSEIRGSRGQNNVFERIYRISSIPSYLIRSVEPITRAPKRALEWYMLNSDFERTSISEIIFLRGMIIPVYICSKIKKTINSFAKRFVKGIGGLEDEDLD